VSTDRSAEIFRSYDDPRLRYFLAPTHTMLYEGRNRAIANAAGEFLAFLDVDDWWRPEKLEKQVSLFDDPEVGLACSHYWIVDEAAGTKRKFPRKKIPTGRILNALLGNYPVGLLTLVLRRTAFAALPHGCDPRFHIIGDRDVVVRIAVRWKVAAVQEPLAYYRVHGANEGARNQGLQITEYATWLREMGLMAEIAGLAGYARALNELDYMRGRLSIAEGNLAEAGRLALRLPIGKYKFKLALLLVKARLTRRTTD
jgi:glycosyltransferase involved in cell wall biosynthesis